MDFRVCVNEYNKNGISFIYNVLVYRYQNSEECDSMSFKSILDSKIYLNIDFQNCVKYLIQLLMIFIIKEQNLHIV